MNYRDVKLLCDYIPPEEENILKDHYARHESYTDRDLGLDDPELAKSLCAYKDMSFGWNFSRTLSANHLDFPTTATIPNDEWLWRAYLHTRDVGKYRDDPISHAISMMAPANRMHRAVMDALLVSDEENAETVADRLRIDRRVAKAYEALFFDISGRRSDQMFMCQMVYPQSRLVEFYQHYILNEDLYMILLRAGYNNGPDDVLYLAGLKNAMLAKNASRESVARLEALIMSNGYILARNGWLNSNAAGISGARTLLAAAKQGGQDTTSSPLTQTAGAQMRDELVAFAREGFSQALIAGRPESDAQTQAILAQAGIGV